MVGKTFRLEWPRNSLFRTEQMSATAHSCDTRISLPWYIVFTQVEDGSEGQ